MKLIMVLTAMALAIGATEAHAKAYTKEDAAAAKQEVLRTKAEKQAQASKDDCPFKTAAAHNGRSPAQTDQLAQLLASGKQVELEKITPALSRSHQAN